MCTCVYAVTFLGPQLMQLSLCSDLAQVTDLDERDAAPAASEPAAAAAEGEPARGADGEAGASNGGAEEPGGSGTHRSVFLRGEGEGAVAFARRVFRRVYGTDIERVLRMEDLWKAR